MDRQKDLAVDGVHSAEDAARTKSRVEGNREEVSARCRDGFALFLMFGRMGSRARWLSSIARRITSQRYSIDALFILVLLGFSLYLMRHLFDWNNKALASDLSGAWAWFYWLKESLLTFHQFPTWSPLWMGGMPFFGIVPPAGFITILPFYFVTGDVPAAYNLATIVMFCLAGPSMYFYLKHLSQNSLVSFLGALTYVTLPVHMNSMMFWGHFEILCAYAIIPLVLLLTERSLDGKRQINIVLLGLLVSFVLLLQIEYALIFVLFYLCYIIFALTIRGIGLRSLSALIKRNKAGVILCLLILLIPLSFYMTVLIQYSHFSSLTPEQIKGGLSVYTLKHLSDPFQDRMAGGLEGYFAMPTADYYSGGISFVILLGALASAILEKGRSRAQLLFFLLIGMVSLILSMGVFGPLFPPLRKIIPFLSGMRVPLRFYYIFALCLPVLFALSALSFSKVLARVPGWPTASRRLVTNGVPVLLIVVLIVDLSPYFDFYHYRVLDKDAYNRVSSFLEGHIEEDGLPPYNIARVLVVPDGADPDRIASLERSRDGGQFTIEVSQSWLTWNQYEAAFDYDSTVYGRIFRDRQSLHFYSDLLSYDYIMMYEHNLPPPSLDSTYLYLMDRLAETLDSFCSDGYQTLIDKGSLETPYYTAHLYRINKDVLAKARFYAFDDLLIMEDNGLYTSNTLCDIYSELGYDVSSASFLKNVVAISGEEEIHEAILSSLIRVGGVCFYGDEALLLPNDPLAAQVLKVAECQTEGWTEIKRSGSLGFPDSGRDMAVADAEQDNYLRNTFNIETAGNWILSLSFLSDTGTGNLEIYVDGEQIAIVDTYGAGQTIRNHTAALFLNSGPHELRLVGRRSLRTTEATMASSVEVGRIAFLNHEELPQMIAQSRSLWSRIAEVSADRSASGLISDFRSYPKGISLDVYAADEGILSIAYYANPWWRVYVNGKEVELIRVNGIFPSCFLEEGQHHVEFIYDYPSLTNTVSRLWR